MKNKCKTRILTVITLLLMYVLFFSLILNYLKNNAYNKDLNNTFNYAADEYTLIDLTRPGLPTYLKKIIGLSFQEKWGRWSEHSESPSTVLIFNNSLPHNFRLNLKLIKIQNEKQSISISAGNATKNITLDKDIEPFSLDFEKIDFSTKSITLTPRYIYKAGDSDARYIGFGISYIEVIPIN